MTDMTIKLGRSELQHGPNSQRVYLMKLHPGDLPDLCIQMEELARAHGYGKIFAKVSADSEEVFLRRGYVREAMVPGYFGGVTAGVFLGLFLDTERAVDPRRNQVESILQDSLAQAASEAPPLPKGFECRALTESDIDSLAALYHQIFATYPFPIQRMEYLRQTMRSHVAYYGVFDGGDLAAAASSEIDTAASAVEMTDFATAPEHVGRGLARNLLSTMTAAMRNRGIRTAMTIARSISAGMNRVFVRCGFQYGGTLVNNTGICGSIESMNVWHQPLSRA